METENKMQVFNNDEFGSVRTVIKDGEPWFVAVDVCRALDIDATATRRLDEDEKSALRLTQTSSNGTEQGRDVIVISESGLYSLVLGSRKPEAKAFKRWITHEVIPTIRKTGGYVANDDLFVETYFGDADESMKSAFRATLERVRRLNEEKKALNETVAVQSQQIAEMRPKVTYYDVILNSPDAITMSVIAKDYGKSAKWLNKKLNELAYSSSKEISGFSMRNTQTRDIRKRKHIHMSIQATLSIQESIRSGHRKGASSCMIS